MLALCTMALAPHVAHADGFAAYVSPPRIVAQAQPATTVREVVEIQHVGNQRGAYRLYTNDWTMDEAGNISFSQELLPGSCRQWVTIERYELHLDPGQTYRYRLQVTPPTGTPDRECRFALMVEGMEAAQINGVAHMAVGGRIAVIVYVAVGRASPKLELVELRTRRLNTGSSGAAGAVDNTKAFAVVRNTGLAHGRLEGVLAATDAAGKSLEFGPAEVPILPGTMREVELNVLSAQRLDRQGKMVDTAAAAPAVKWPVQLRGKLEWGTGTGRGGQPGDSGHSLAVTAVLDAAAPTAGTAQAAGPAK